MFPDPITGAPRVAYTPSAFDRAHTLAGVIALAKLCYVEGAQEIFTFLPGTQPFVRRRNSNSNKPSSPFTISSTHSPAADDPTTTDPEFASWITSLQSTGNNSPATPFGSAHQMGTCRMSATPETGVVDPTGRVWGVEGLYVADASVFPSATGVNPMLTAMAIADHIAREVVGSMTEEAAGEGGRKD